LLGGWPPKYAAGQHWIALPDGDSVVLHDDCPPTWQPGGRAVLMVHGLGGSHRSPYVARTCAKLNARGVRTFRMDLRAHGAGIAKAAQLGHAGRSHDVAAALERVRELCPQATLHLVGFSMGANIVLKLAAELGPRVPPNLVGLFAAAPPVNLELCCRNLKRGWNFVYDGAFVRNLRRHLRAWRRANPEARFALPAQRLRGVFDFDEYITAPRSGFRDAAHYYSESSCGPLLANIRLPTIILAAADDPVVPVSCFDKLSYSPCTQLVVTEHGGHLGYIGRAGRDTDSRWLDWRIVDWVLAERQSVATPRKVVTELSAPVLAPAVCRSF
jgi:predicted alpha/beta-fold hydrolase